MKICLLEPLGVSRELIEELSAPIREAGHEFIAYDPENHRFRGTGRQGTGLPGGHDCQ